MTDPDRIADGTQIQPVIIGAERKSTGGLFNITNKAANRPTSDLLNDRG